MAVITGTGIYYVLSDHLNTPRQIINSSGQLRWRWDNLDPFGANAPNTNPAGLGGFTYNLRFPGQYADAETGLFYNVFRSYDSKGGRYTQSDPVGLAGGLNTYAYVGGNPVNAVDPLGLWAFSFEVYGGVGGGVAFGRDDSTGQPFFALRYGYGYGGGFDYDPFGKRPGSNSEDISHGMSAGLYCKAGVRNGPFKGGLGANAGAETGANSNYFYGSFASPKFSFTNRGAGISASAAAGAEFSFFGQGK